MFRVASAVFALALVVLLWVSAVAPAHAADTTWKANPAVPGDWFLAGNWTYGVPTGPYGYAYINNGGEAQITSGSAASYQLYLGQMQTYSGTLTLGGTGQYSGNTVYVGGSYSNGGTGRFVQTGGSNTLSRQLLIANSGGSNGTYELSGGSLSAQDEAVGNSNYYYGAPGIGRFIHTGGTNTATGGLGIASPGNNSYELSGTGALVVGSLNVGGPTAGTVTGTGLFRQNGGSSTVTGTMYIGNGGSGTYELVDGTFSAVKAYVGGSQYGGSGGSVTGLFRQTGGTATVSDRLYVANGIAGTYELSGTAQLSADSVSIASGYAYPSLTGRFTQTGGTHTIAKALVVGENSATGIYELGGTGQLSAATETIGSGGTGRLTQTAGTNTVSDVLYIGGLTSGTGTYELGGTGALSARAEFIGPNGSLLKQTGGSNTVGYLSIRANSQYSFTGGTLAIANGGLNIDGTLNMGNNPVTIAAGDNTVINLAKGTLQGYARLTLNVGANSLTILPDGLDPTTAFAGFSSAGFVHELGSDLVVPAGQGFAGSGTIEDRVACEGTITATAGRVLILRKGLSVSGGGSVNLGGRSADAEAVAGTLTVNDNSSGVNFGQLTAAIEYIGTGSNTAVQFLHAAGSNTVLENLYLAYDGPSKAVYELARTGSLTAPVEWIGYNGIGQFRQSGGSNSVEYLHVGGGSRYTYSGGTLQVTDNGGIELKGTLDFAGSAMAVNVGNNTLVDLSGSVENSSLASLAVGANSLTIFANGFDPGTSLASFTTGGMTHTAGTELVVGAGEGFTVAGVIPDHVRSEGTIGVPVGRGLAMNNGLTLNGGSVALGEYSARDKRGVLTVNDTVSGISAGQLTAAYQYVGVDRTGQFTQTAGSNTLQYDLTLGSAASVQGTYDLSGTGQLSARSEYVGKNFTGRFIQSGGSNTMSTRLYLGEGGGGNGTYELSGGTLTAYYEYFGDNKAAGHFVQTGGTHTVNSSMYIGRGEGLESTYELSGDSAQLLTDRVYLGDGKSIGRFVQTGGTHTVDGSLYIADGDSAIGSYDLAAGTLSAYREELGDSYYKSSARFNQTGGTNTTKNLDIYQGGVYTLGGGSLATEYLTIEGAVDLPATFELANPAATMTVSNKLSFQPGSVIKAAAGSTIHMTGSTFENESTNPTALAGLENLGLVFEGGTQDVDNFEVAGQNLGAIPAGFKANFALGRLALGGADVGQIKLVDAIDNQPAFAGKEALYVWELSVGNGSSLDLGGLNLYYRAGSIAPGATIVANGGNLVPVTVYDGDLDLNAKVDIFDVAVLQAKYGTTKGATWADGDFDRNGTVDIFDVALLQVSYGAGVASAPSPVPEPATLILALAGLAALAVCARRRGRR